MLDYDIHPKRLEYTNPAKFWVDQASSFPALAKLARKYMGIPASAVLSEQTWSHAGQINSAARERMTLSTLIKLLFLNRNSDLEVLTKRLNYQAYKHARDKENTIAQACELKRVTDAARRAAMQRHITTGGAPQGE